MSAAERRPAYRVEPNVGGVPVLRTFDVLITPKRMAVTSPRTPSSMPHTEHWEPRDFPARFDWQPLDAWRRYLAQIEKDREDALASIEWLDKEIAVARAEVGA